MLTDCAQKLMATAFFGSCVPARREPRKVQMSGDDGKRVSKVADCISASGTSSSMALSAITCTHFSRDRALKPNLRQLHRGDRHKRLKFMYYNRASAAMLKTHALPAIPAQPADHLHNAEDLLGAKPAPVSLTLDAVISWQAMGLR